MKNVLVVTLFMLAALPWALAQQPGSPDQAEPQGQASSAPITEGCLGGSDPNYTITDKTGTAYKLNLPPKANPSTLASHVGESVQVKGDVKNAGKANASIDVQAIGRGASDCPASGTKGAQPPPHQ